MSPTQVVLINAVKDVAKALGDLISATKAAAGKVGDDPAVWQLKNSAKVGSSEEQQQEGWGWLTHFLLLLKMVSSHSTAALR
jgi:hypothetical protein